MDSCKTCRQEAVIDWLDLGRQALTNRFLSDRDEAEYVHPLALGVCPHCGTVQLDCPPPAEELRPRFDWIAYNEPESHLDELAATIAKLPGLHAASAVAGLTEMDASTLRRLRDLGFAATWVADRRADLGVEHPCAGTESIQESLTAAAAERVVARRGRPDVVVLRYVLEHAHDVHELLRSLKTLAAEDGYVVIEVPDARGAMNRLDYSTIWEEHVFYFSPATLHGLLTATGLEIVFLKSYPCALDHPLVAIAKPAVRPTPSAKLAAEVAGEIAIARRFIGAFPEARRRCRVTLESLRQTAGRLAFLGASHLSAAYVNFFGVMDLFDVVVDDNPNKQGLFMPGSRLPIEPSKALVERGIGACLMGVRPEIEDAVLRKNAAFTASGGRMLSIFPESRYSLAAWERTAWARKAG